MNPRIPLPLRLGNAALVFIQERLNAVFTSRFNPAYNLGALGYFFFWTLLITGVYLYIFYDMSMGGAYDSVQRMTVGQKYYGGVIRSVHRYASSGLMAVAALHLLQTFFSDRFRRYRWLAWVSGVVILPVLWLEGVSGYMMVFDDRGLLASVQLGGWLDAVPLAVEPFSRNFIPSGTLSSLFFFLLTYLHLTLPAAMIFILWIHCMRISRPIINAPGILALSLGFALIVLAIFKPALSGPPADISKLTATTEIDWFYLFPFTLSDALSANPSGALLAAVFGFFLLALAPWMIRDAPAVPAVVDLANCTGCEQCQKACPFEAINIKPRSDGRHYEREVEILPERCASCGLCLPACPFPALAIGPWTKEYFARRISAALPNGGAGITMVFSCERAVANEAIFSEVQNVVVITVPCVGILGGKAIEECLGAGVDGVVVVSCVSEDCHYRLSRRKLDITRIEISGIKRLKIIDVSMSDPQAAVEAVRRAGAEFAGISI